LLHEARAAGVPVAIASDNTRDQFYAYGDLDMLEVFTQGCRMAHLDRPYGDWVRCVTAVPADAMGLGRRGAGRLAAGGPADLVIFRGRRYSELLARPQLDRVVVRAGAAIDACPPDYAQLDYVPEALRSGEVPVEEVQFSGPGAAPEVLSRLGAGGGMGRGTRGAARGAAGRRLAVAAAAVAVAALVAGVLQAGAV
jgi:hypothetical protein